jgi:soluble lytic murein transglycosylase
MRKKLLILLALSLLVATGVLAAWRYWTTRYDKLIAATADQHGLDPALVKAIVYEESFFSPRARSSQNAVGLMQVTPVVAQEWVESIRARSLTDAAATVTSNGRVSGAEQGFEETLCDPAVSLHVGCWYLQTLLKRYRDNADPLSLALAAYNAGPSNVERWASETERARISRDEFIARIDFPVTRNYIQKIIQRYGDYKRDGVLIHQ